MADEGNADTFEYTLAGRTMTLRKTTRAQLMMMQRVLLNLQKQMARGDDGANATVMAMSQMLEMTFEAAESRFLNPLDLEFVRLGIIRGDIDEGDIMGILANGARRTDEPDDAEPPAPKRAAKAPGKKAPAKKTANPRRVAR